VEELIEIERSARNRLLFDDHSDLIGLTIDLARALRGEVESRLHGPRPRVRVDPTPFVRRLGG